MRLAASKTWFLLALCGLFVPCRGGEEPDRERKRFGWSATYAEALDLALARKCPLLVYFPPVRGEREPRILALAPKVLGVPPAAEGVRVGADDVSDLVSRYKVRAVPAVLLLDRRENVIHRWDGTIPRNFWRTIQSLLGRVARAEKAVRKTLRDAHTQAAKDDLEGAYRKVARILGSRQTPPDSLLEAKEIEARLVRRVREGKILILAREGTDSDKVLLEDLRKLRAGTRHPGNVHRSGINGLINLIKR